MPGPAEKPPLPCGVACCGVVGYLPPCGLLTLGLMDGSSSPDGDTDAREEELRLKMEEEKTK